MHSTELAALELSDRILKDVDEGNISLAIFMDLSKAFDTLDHQVLLKKLNFYGIGGPALDWFSSYLTGRQQYIELDGVSSDLLPLSTGVPQGSILGPLLFLIYMNDMPNASEAFKYILYADDTTLFNTIQISVGAPLDINNQLAKISDWLAVNKLSLNVKKTKFVKHIFSTCIFVKIIRLPDIRPCEHLDYGYGGNGPIDQSHRCGRPEVTCREPVGSYDKTTRAAICF